MARVTVEDCLDKVSNRFTLVILVAKRVRQFLSGDQPLVSAKNKYVVNALREVAAGAVTTNLSKEEMALKLESILKRSSTVSTSSETVAKEDG